ncbi:MAG TPA: glycogen debranching N-terminal domain-containing protein [Steroidobacteraceae bacterium]|nr:glycogen debranching N-terminal domain-containing protein [Steroidobacteraceae bacterium]
MAADPLTGGTRASDGYGDCATALFYRDTWFLSRYELTVNGTAPVPLASHEGGGAWAFHVLDCGRRSTE